MLNLVGEELSAAAALLKTRQLEFEVSVTRPDRSSFSLSADYLYVVRQTQSASGACLLVAAAKMEKEV
ncbi:MAG: hypothetical protein P4N41_24295 [Negativicutes bacterium]|nr:hypothetical protein [Negativicutes bacterium]